jgi:hypothetical protein
LTPGVHGRSRIRKKLLLAVMAALVCGVFGCTQMRDFAAPELNVGGEWRDLLVDLRVFEAQIGFRPTRNFLALASEQKAFPFCGRASRLHLPWSYEDPAIEWRDAASEEQCREDAEGLDVFYGSTEALGEVGSPVTPAMLTGRFDRFVYLVIHEDCHDQFNLPFGIEEALCDAITYRAMAAFAAEKFRWYSPENRAVRSYAASQSKAARVTIEQYERLAALYARYGRREVSEAVLLRERAALFVQAERALAIGPGLMNNVVLANHMTYSRHYPFLDTVFEAYGGELAPAIAFFKRADAAKPGREEVLERRAIAEPKSVEAIRAYEEAVLESIAARLAAERPQRTRN